MSTPQTPTLQVSFGLLDSAATQQGTIQVKKVDKYSSLGKGGVVAGDELVSAEGQKIGSADQLKQRFDKAGVGGTVSLRVVRAGKTLDLTVKMEAKKAFKLDVEEVRDAFERKIAP